MRNRIISAIVFIVIIVTTAYIVITKDDRFYLSDEYYNNNSFIEITSDQVDGLINKKYILYTYNNYCSFTIPCDKIFQKFSERSFILFFEERNDFVNQGRAFLHERSVPLIIDSPFRGDQVIVVIQGIRVGAFS